MKFRLNATCRGVSAENWKLARRPGLKARLGYSGKSKKEKDNVVEGNISEH